MTLKEAKNSNIAKSELHQVETMSKLHKVMSFINIITFFIGNAFTFYLSTLEYATSAKKIGAILLSIVFTAMLEGISSFAVYLLNPKHITFDWESKYKGDYLIEKQ